MASRRSKSAGQLARAEAVRHLEVIGADLALHAESLDRYQRAVDRVDVLNAAWEREGSPTTTGGGATGSALVPHPLVKMIQDAEREAAFHAKALGIDLTAKRGVGRPKAAVSAPDRKAEPPRLSRIK